MSDQESSFDEEGLDEILARWLSGELSQTEFVKLQHRLQGEADFRESLAHWLIALREPRCFQKFGKDV